MGVILSFACRALEPHFLIFDLFNKEEGGMGVLVSDFYVKVIFAPHGYKGG